MDYVGHTAIQTMHTDHVTCHMTDFHAHSGLQDTFQVDFVVQVADNPRVVDNNRGRDFSLPLRDPPSAEAVMRSRAQAATDFERQAMQVRNQASSVQFSFSVATYVLGG